MNANSVNLADEGAIKSKARDERLAFEQWNKDLNELMNTPAGKRVMFKIMGYAGLMTRCMTGNSETYFRLGKQDVALWLYEELQRAAPQELARTMIENSKTMKNYGEK